MHDYLKRILDKKAAVVSALKADFEWIGKLHPILTSMDLPSKAGRFKDALSNPGLNVIAEVKRQSPSKGYLAEISDPIKLASTYADAGAAAISVLTDKFGFNGSVEDLAAVTDAVSIPVLRKDFVIDRVQIAEAVYHGASAVLLIVAVLGDSTRYFVNACRDMKIDALVEVHNEAECEVALEAGAQIIGINNRNLTTFDVDVQNACRLRELIPNDIISVAESGIHDLATAKLYQDNFNAVLIGEALVKAEDPTQLISEIRNG